MAPSEVEDNCVGNISGIRTRLRNKTKASLAPGYPLRPLLKRAEHKIKMNQMKLAKRKRKAEFKQARIRAIELMSMQPPPSALAREERDEIGNFEIPHSSHRIVTMHGCSEIIFCKVCCCWSAKTKLRLLALPCQNLKTGNSSLRLLECGVMPGPQARIPSHLKKRHCSTRRRRSRW